MTLLQKVGSAILGLAVVITMGFAALKFYSFSFERGVAYENERMLKEQSDKTKERMDAQDKNDTAVAGQVKEKIVYRDRYVTKIKKEVEYVTAPMAECVMPDAAVRLWNDSSRCLLDPKAAGCGVHN